MKQIAYELFLYLGKTPAVFVPTIFPNKAYPCTMQNGRNIRQLHRKSRIPYSSGLWLACLVLPLLCKACLLWSVPFEETIKPPVEGYSFSVTGVLQDISCFEGQWVEPGDTLLRLQADKTYRKWQQQQQYLETSGAKISPGDQKRIRASLLALQQEYAYRVLLAQQQGYLVWLDSLSIGQSVLAGQRLLKINLKGLPQD